jgi:hypothetical protein
MHNLGMPFVEPKASASGDTTKGKSASGKAGADGSTPAPKKSISSAAASKSGKAPASNAEGTKANPSAVSEREQEARKQKMELINKKRQQQQ